MVWNITYLILWQAAWFAAVIAGAHDRPWLGLATVVPAVVLAAWRYRRAALVIIGWSLLIGLVVDGILLVSGVMRAAGSLIDGPLSPPWMWGLWIAMGLAFPGPMAWLRGRWLWLSLFGLVGGPLAYLGGVKFAALSAPEGLLPFLAVNGLLYAIAIPLLVRLLPTIPGAPSTSSANEVPHA